MNDRAGDTIGVFYSLGPHFAATLGRLRELHPDARIVAIVPHGFPIAGEENSLADEVVETELAHYSSRDVAACLRLISRLRGARYDLFVVMFASARLGLLASLSGSRRRACAPPQGTLIPLESGPLRTLASEALRRVTGALVFAGLHAMTRLTRIRT